jgi:hypothetical protein
MHLCDIARLWLLQCSFGFQNYVYFFEWMVLCLAIFFNYRGYIMQMRWSWMVNTFGFGRWGNCTTHSQGSQTFSIFISEYVNGNVLTGQLTGGCPRQIIYHVISNLWSCAVRLPWTVDSYWQLSSFSRSSGFKTHRYLLPASTVYIGVF